MSQVTITTTSEVIRSLTENYLVGRVIQARANGVKNFTMPELIGSKWPDELIPFCNLYKSERTAGCELGKLLGRVGSRLGLSSKREDRRGRKDAITRYDMWV